MQQNAKLKPTFNNKIRKKQQFSAFYYDIDTSHQLGKYDALNA